MLVFYTGLTQNLSEKTCFRFYYKLGNYLLANSKALIFSGLFFKGKESELWLVKGEKILNTEYKEQILKDGGHFELSPMYHAIITHYLLYCYELIDNNYWEECKLKELIGETLSRAISFYKFISIDDY